MAQKRPISDLEKEVEAYFKSNKDVDKWIMGLTDVLDEARLRNLDFVWFLDGEWYTDFGE